MSDMLDKQQYYEHNSNPFFSFQTTMMMIANGEVQGDRKGDEDKGIFQGRPDHVWAHGSKGEGKS